MNKLRKLPKVARLTVQPLKPPTVPDSTPKKKKKRDD